MAEATLRQRLRGCEEEIYELRELTRRQAAGLVEALKQVGNQSSGGLRVASPTQFLPSDDEGEASPESSAGDAERSLEQAQADIKRLKAEVSVQRKKIRAGGRLLKRLAKEHKVRLDVDPVTWEPVSDRPVEVPADQAP